MSEAAYTTQRSDGFEMVPAMVMVILDVGCSNGALAGGRRLVLADRQLVGIERYAGFVAQAASQLDRVIQAVLDTVEWRREFPDAMFDCVIFGDVLEHLLDPWLHLAEARRCLRPGGTVVIGLPKIRLVSSLYGIFIYGTFPRRDRGIFDRTHLHWFTPHDARKLVVESGLKVEATSYNLRIGDKRGGLLNRIAGRLFDPISGFASIREFFAYQVCLRASAGQLP